MSTFLKSSRGRMVDDRLVLKAKGTVATSMVGEDPIGTDKSHDAGGATRGAMVLNVYAVPNLIAGANFTMRLQGGKTSTFASLTDLAIVELGDAAGISSESDKGVGRYIVPFTNAFDGTVYRHLRHSITCGGTVGTGIEYECYLTNLV